MEKLRLYLVTKSSTDNNIEKGDLIWLSENGDLNSVMGCGWLSEEEWNVLGTNDFECEVSTTHYLDVERGRESVRKIKS